jgi:hypothetical protein
MIWGFSKIDPEELPDDLLLLETMNAIKHSNNKFGKDQLSTGGKDVPSPRTARQKN